MKPIYLPLFIVLFVCSGCDRDGKDDGYESISVNQRGLIDNERIPNPNREFRAAWVATVNNIDWPSQAGLTKEQQQGEAIFILDRLVQLNMNAVIFQARPQADALYPSTTEPWSNVLTGKQGQSPGYDPMAFWIREAHKRGLLFHAWMNPFRANHKSHSGPISPLSVIEKNPDWVVKLGTAGYIWLKPTKKEVRKYARDVILEVVNKYDIDGLHIDDYFYPYPSYNDGQDFPDDEDYKQYRKWGGKLSQDDWRRAAVNGTVRDLYSSIKNAKPHVEFGISPFGIWRPGHPSGTVGLDQYQVLYADPKLWLNEGWLDYIAPQLYWPISKEGQSYPSLLNWWSSQNTQKRHLWPGISLVDTGTATGVSEVSNQIQLTRKVTRGQSGMCLFSANWLANPRHEILKALVDGPWKQRAIAPESRWLNSAGDPQAPKLEVLHKRGGDLIVRFKPIKDAKVFQYVLNEKLDGKWQAPVVIPGFYGSYTIKHGVTSVAVRTVDRHRKISEFSIIESD